ncbi:hypothetical protein [Caulobacter sp. NIBR1757]|nr:hypothetical protein [Caulobacter sp. NIBR1757]WGM37383.1 hypothetical protein AMEJIAPC_00281 [Caulobacter sp. NIBR1757]
MSGTPPKPRHFLTDSRSSGAVRIPKPMNGSGLSDPRSTRGPK